MPHYQEVVGMERSFEQMGDEIRRCRTSGPSDFNVIVFIVLCFLVFPVVLGVIYYLVKKSKLSAYEAEIAPKIKELEERRQAVLDEADRLINS